MIGKSFSLVLLQPERLKIQIIIIKQLVTLYYYLIVLFSNQSKQRRHILLLLHAFGTYHNHSPDCPLRNSEVTNEHNNNIIMRGNVFSLSLFFLHFCSSPSPIYSKAIPKWFLYLFQFLCSPYALTKLKFQGNSYQFQTDSDLLVLRSSVCRIFCGYFLCCF